MKPIKQGNIIHGDWTETWAIFPIQQTIERVRALYPPFDDAAVSGLCCHYAVIRLWYGEDDIERFLENGHYTPETMPVGIFVSQLWGYQEHTFEDDLENYEDPRELDEKSDQQKETTSYAMECRRRRA